MDKPIPEALAAEAAALLTTWLDEEECECEPYGHSCGRPNVIRVRDDLLALTAAQQQWQAVAYPTGSDREVLQYLMHQFDAEQWNCPRCGHSEATSDMDSADYLRRYLAAAPPSAPVGVDAAALGRFAQDAWMDSHADYPAWGRLTETEQAAWIAVGARIKRVVSLAQHQEPTT